MLIIPPAKFSSRGRPKRTAAPPVLVSASYDPVGLVIVVAFDRNMRIIGIDGTQITLNDPVVNATLYQATGSVGRVNLTTLQIGLTAVGESTGLQTLLNASQWNGVTARIGDGVWTGVSDLALPFP